MLGGQRDQSCNAPPSEPPAFGSRLLKLPRLALPRLHSTNDGGTCNTCNEGIIEGTIIPGSYDSGYYGAQTSGGVIEGSIVPGSITHGPIVHESLAVGPRPEELYQANRVGPTPHPNPTYIETPHERISTPVAIPVASPEARKIRP